ncbi:MAG TPA: SDR family NAD(P)-dependent oxidoreductase [Candidatus Saccharibacteria bacterium]|nr:SDR family NAD(P)-dependent oxidoreductase [Candidatus Saccharibacteria bacterium]
MQQDFLKNKTVIIIGATSGLGEAMAVKLNDRASKLILTGRDLTKLQSLRDQLGAKVEIRQLDLTDNESIEQFSSEIIKLNDQDIVLISNAGIWLEGDTEQEDFKKIEDVIRTNLTGHMQLVSAILPKLKLNKKGHIVFINSVAGLDFNPGNSFYSASKFGLTGFAKTLQPEVVDDNIKVSLVHPGGMDTDLFNRAGHDYGKAPWMMNKNDVAEIVIEVINQPENILIDQISVRTFPDNIIRYGQVG